MKPANSPLLQNYLSQEELAPEIGVTTRTLERWRTEKTGPAFTRIGRRPMYSRTSLQKWLDSQERATKAATDSSAA